MHTYCIYYYIHACIRTSYSYIINTVWAYLNNTQAKCMLHLNFFIVFVCLFVSLSRWGGVRANHQSVGRRAEQSRSRRRTGSAGAGSPREHTFPGSLGGGITATRGLLIAPRPRQYVCGRDTSVPAPTPPLYSHSSFSSFSFFPGKGRASPALAPPRLTSDALRRLRLPPSRSASSVRAARALPRRVPLPARQCPPPSSGSPFIHFQSLPDFCGLMASLAACW